MGPDSGGIQYGVYASGPNVIVQLSALTSSGSTLDFEGVYADMGASIRLGSCTFINGNVALHIGPGTGGTSISAVGNGIVSNTTRFFNKDIFCESPTGNINYIGYARSEKIDIVAGTVLTTSLLDGYDGGPNDAPGLVCFGELYLGTESEAIPLRAYGQDTYSTGWINGGVLTAGTGLKINISSGKGYINTGFGVKQVDWDTASVPIASNNLNYIFVNSDGYANSSIFGPDLNTNILLGVTFTSDSSIISITDHNIMLGEYIPSAFTYKEKVIGSTSISGCVASIHSPPSLQIDVDQGSFYIGAMEHSSTASAPITFTYWYKNGFGGWKHVTNSTQIDTGFYDNGTGTLAAVTGTKYKKDLLFITPNNTSEFHIVYGQQLFDSQVLSEVGNNPNAHDALLVYGFRVAGITSLSGAAYIASIVDARPKLGQLSSGTTSITRHGDLSGLANDDHCFSDDTELLTKRGFINYEDIQESDEALTLNLDSGKLEYQTIRGKYVYDSFKEMVSLKSRYGEILVTPKHTMIYQNTCKAEKNPSAKWLKCTAEQALTRSVFNVPTGGFSDGEVCNLSNKMLELLGLVISEGSFMDPKRYGYGIRLYQLPGEQSDYIESVLKDVGAPYTKRTNQTDIYLHWILLGT